MPLAGTGMLLMSMNIDAADEADFNRWYDREHLEERVAIDGFLEARRYVAHAANPKYLSLYSTETLDVLDSPAYRARLANQTEWSRRTMAHFKDMLRVVARITVSNGTGRGAALGVVHFFADPDKLRAEYAVAVRSDWKGRGLGYLLMTRLIDVARQRGISELVGEVLRENEPMLQMCRELGFVVSSNLADPGVMLVRKKLTENRL